MHRSSAPPPSQLFVLSPLSFDWCAMASSFAESSRRSNVFISRMKRRRETDCKEGLYDGWLVDEVYDLVSEKPGHFGCKMRITAALCNMYRGAHGGLIALIIDTLGTAALGAAVPKDEEPTPSSFGMSTELNVSYLRAVPLGSEIRVDATVVKQGGSLATVQVDIFTCSATGDVLAASGRHTKYMKIRATVPRPRM